MVDDIMHAFSTIAVESGGLFTRKKSVLLSIRSSPLSRLGLQSRNKREKEIKKFVHDDIKNTNMDSMYQKGIDRCMIS